MIKCGRTARSNHHGGKVLAALSFVVLTAMSLAACGGGSTPKSVSPGSTVATQDSARGGTLPGQGKTIGLILIGGNTFVQGLASGVLNELEPAGYKVKIMSSNFSTTTELANFSSLIAAKVSGIICLPVTADSAGRGAILAKAAGIPTVNMAWNKGAGDSAWTARIRYNYTEQAPKLAAWLNANEKPGEVLEIQGTPGNPTSDDFDSVVPAINALGKGWKVVGQASGGYVSDKAITAAQNLMTAHPNANIIVTAAAAMADGVASYISRTGIKGKVVVTTDGDTPMLGWMKDNIVVATLFLSSGQNGMLSAEAMRQVIESGKSFPTPQNMPMSIQTPATIDAAVSKNPMIYPTYAGQAAASF